MSRQRGLFTVSRHAHFLQLACCVSGVLRDRHQVMDDIGEAVKEHATKTQENANWKTVANEDESIVACGKPHYRGCMLQPNHNCEHEAGHGQPAADIGDNFKCIPASDACHCSRSQVRLLPLLRNLIRLGLTIQDQVCILCNIVACTACTQAGSGCYQQTPIHQGLRDFHQAFPRLPACGGILTRPHIRGNTM